MNASLIEAGKLFFALASALGIDRYSINEVVREYNDLLRRLVVDAANGNIKAAGFASQMLSGLREDAEAVYVEGMREGGIDNAADILDDDDKLTIDNWIDAQTEFISGFAADAVAVGKLKGDANTEARRIIFDRAELWVANLRNLGARGYARAKEGVKARWVLGETEKHCKDCLRYSTLAPKRMKYWLDNEKLPRSPDLACSGFNCDCSLVDAKGRVLYP